jgi:predicted DNA repair protein MutK
MPSGLAALLDDIAGITRLAAASLDDVGAAAGRAGTKAVGVVIDDTAVTPRYVTGLSPARELPIIGRIALGSIRNKLLILLPVALLLSAFAPWALTPLLMVGGAYLSFEGAEKLWEAIAGHEAAPEEAATPTDPAALEQQKVSGAVRTDFILSAEIMAIALAEVADTGIVAQAVALALVALAITAGVYGVVAIIVKLDDVGLHLAKRDSAAVQALGRGMVKAMPVIMSALATIGTAAMIWVGGGIIVHGLAGLGWAAPEHVIHHAAETVAGAVPGLHGVLAWVVTAVGSGIVGLVVGGVIAAAVHAWKHRKAH